MTNIQVRDNCIWKSSARTCRQTTHTPDGML